MTRSRYRFGEDHFPHFMTATVVAWLPVFSNPSFVWANVLVSSSRSPRPPSFARCTNSGTQPCYRSSSIASFDTKSTKHTNSGKRGVIRKPLRTTRSCGRRSSTSTTTRCGAGMWMIPCTGDTQVPDLTPGSRALSTYVPTGGEYRGVDSQTWRQSLRCSAFPGRSLGTSHLLEPPFSPAFLGLLKL